MLLAVPGKSHITFHRQKKRIILPYKVQNQKLLIACTLLGKMFDLYFTQ